MGLFKEIFSYMARKGDRDLNTHNFVLYPSMGNNIVNRSFVTNDPTAALGGQIRNKKKKFSSPDDLITSYEISIFDVCLFDK